MVRKTVFVLLATALLASPASADEFDCAGLSAVPDGWTYGADRDGNPMIFSQHGEVVWCDGQSRSLASSPATEVLGVATAPTSTFEAPFGLEGTWTMAASLQVPTMVSELVGYLGASADMQYIFWRSSPGGPIEVWVLGASLTE